MLLSAEKTIFFAIVTKRNDGHKYIDELYQKGVTCFVVSKTPTQLKKFTNGNFILVNDTLNSLQLLSSKHRQFFNIPVIGITGSNGKTIVKEWLYQLLYEDKKITKSPKSYNSQIGVPLSVWQMNSDHELAIFEAGISMTNEMEKLQKIIKPNIGIFTNIGHAHDKNFKNKKHKVDEKLKLFSDSETIIYCCDYTIIYKQMLSSGLLENTKTFTWSRRVESDLFIKNIEKKQNLTKITGLFKGELCKVTIPFTDAASIENAIFCWATMFFLGYKNEDIAQKIFSLTPIEMRLELKEGINNCTLINDSYSSDIDSLNIALDFLNQQKQYRKKTVILSDILQSRRKESDLYSTIAELLARKNVNHVIGIGKKICQHSEKFQMEKTFFASTEEFLNRYPESLFNNESILIKGARIFEFEKISKVLQQKAHETVLEINLNALIHNLNFFRSKLKPITKIMVMVKAFSYGSGSFEIANILQYHNVDYLAVAYADEGIELRKAGIKVPIMVMNPDKQSFEGIINNNLEPEIYNFRVLTILEDCIKNTTPEPKQAVPVHIKVDTGMRRLGFEENELQKLINRINDNKHIFIKSIFSHLAASDDAKHDEFSRLQVKKLEEISVKVRPMIKHPVLVHLLNSSGISRFPEAQFDMVRLGIGLYGISLDAEEQKLLENVSTLKTTISQIKQVKAEETIGYNRATKVTKETTIGIIPIGYADGLNRNLGNKKGKLLIKGKMAPIIGNICMDMCMVDLSGIFAKEGDEVIVFGDNYSINKLAENMETIPYEVLTSISRRVKRVYFHE